MSLTAAVYLSLMGKSGLRKVAELCYHKAHYLAARLAETPGYAVANQGPFFNEFHAKGNRLDTEAKIAAFFQLYGVDPATFKNTFNSFSVVAKVKRAEELVKRYQAQSTPTIIVNGKYRVSATLAKSLENMIAITNALIKQESATLAVVWSTTGDHVARGGTVTIIDPVGVDRTEGVGNCVSTLLAAAESGVTE